MYHITAIIPALNEEKTIKNILDTVKRVDLIDEVIVVSDGSKDDTAFIAKSSNVKVIESKINRGKGLAVKSGIEISQGDIFVLLDADLVGLTPKHITDLIIPVITDSYEMSIGVFTKGRVKTDFAQKVTPFLSGQRAMKRKIIENVTDLDIYRYGLEIAITKYSQRNNALIMEVPMNNLTHLMKEEKMGFIKGLKERIKMYLDISKFIIKN